MKKKFLIYLSVVMFSLVIFSSCKSSKGCSQGDNVSKYQREVKY